MEIMLSSRSVVVLRSLTVKELNELARAKNRGENDYNEAIAKYIKKSIVEVKSHSYGKDFKVEKLISPDVVDLLLAIRVLNFKKSPYLFEQYCINNSCKMSERSFVEEISIKEVLKERTFLSKEGVTMLQSGNHKVSDSSLGKITWHIPTIQDEAKVKNLVKEYGEGLQVPLMVSIDSVENIEKNDLFEELNKLNGDTLNELADIVEEFECGFLGDIVVECPECKETWSIKLPFSIEAFLPQRPLMKKYKKLQVQYKQYPSTLVYS